MQNQCLRLRAHKNMSFCWYGVWNLPRCLFHPNIFKSWHWLNPSSFFDYIQALYCCNSKRYFTLFNFILTYVKKLPYNDSFYFILLYSNESLLKTDHFTTRISQILKKFTCGVFFICFVTEGGGGWGCEVEKSHFGLAIGLRSSDLDKNWHGHGHWP